MRLKRVRIIAVAVLSIFGAGALVVAFFAFELGLGHNREMGWARVALATVGGLALFLAGLMAFSGQITALWDKVYRQPFIQMIGRGVVWCGQALNQVNFLLERFEKTHLATWLEKRPAAWAALGAGLVTFVSLWYITSGTFTTWTPYTHYFDMQADAFLSGQLSLLETPPQALLNMPDPYDWQKRQSVGGYIWDSSLYNGKYYLYWGPVPALLAAAVKLTAPWVVEDQYLLLFFVSGLAFALAGLLFRLRQSLFPRAPAWTLFALTLLGGLNLPLLWLVNRPSVYETAIAGGQFFLILGLYGAVRAVTTQKNDGWLALAGFAWGAAIGCRVNTGLAIGWMVAVVCLYLIYRAKGSRNWVLPVIYMLIPLALWGAGLAWYNAARFGSILETGHRFQLTGPALPSDYSQVASIAYIPPNLYNLLARPFVVQLHSFPFVFTPYITVAMWPGFIRIVGLYYFSEPISGVLWGVPAFWISLFPLFRLIRTAWDTAWDWLKERPVVAQPPIIDKPAYPWVWAIVGGAAFCSLTALMVFIMTTMRYEADLTPIMTVFTALALWRTLDWLRSRPGAARLVLLLAAVLILFSLAISLFANFQNGDKRFLTNNPELYSALAHFFNPK